MSLTEKGRVVTRAIHKRHSLLFEFFKMICVSEDLANEDAEGIEHHFRTKTLEKLEKFVKDFEVPEKKI
jgi:Mn-dependent DtxR family transcriptional regulator